MGLELTLELRSERMLAGTRMVSGFTVRNGGAAAVELADISWAAAPEPRFRLVAPDGEEQEIQRAGRGAKAAPVRELRPGESWTSDVVIRDGDPEMEPGVYKLRAAMTGPDGTTSEAEAEFTVFAAEFVDVSASIARGPDGSKTLEAVLLGGGEGTRLGAAVLLQESDPRNGEMARPDLQVRGGLPGAATAIHGAQANYDVSEEPLRWLVGTGARAVYVGTNLDRDAAELPMRLGPLALLTPLAEAGERLVLTGVMEGAIARAVYRRGAPAPEWVKIVRTEGRAAAAAVTFWKKGTVVARAENLEKGWRLVVNEISAGGVAVAEKRYSFDGGRVLAGMAATAGTKGLLALTLAVEEAGAVRVWDVTLDEKLEPVAGFAKSAECPAGAGRIGWAQMAGFEVAPGHVSRTAVLYGERGTAVLSPRGEWTVFKPEVRAPLALIPGLEFWYAVRLVAGRMEVMNI